MRVFLRQTMIALRARRQAYRVAADFLYDEPIDTDSFWCCRCGFQLARQPLTNEGRVVCPVCRTCTRAPGHVRSRCRARFSRPVVESPHDQPQFWLPRSIPPELALLLILFVVMLSAALLVVLGVHQ